MHGYVPFGNDAVLADPNSACGISTISYNIERLRDGHGNYYEVAVDPKIKNLLEALMKGYHYHRRDKGLRGIGRSRY